MYELEQQIVNKNGKVITLPVQRSLEAPHFHKRGLKAKLTSPWGFIEYVRMKTWDGELVWEENEYTRNCRAYYRHPAEPGDIE